MAPLTTPEAHLFQTRWQLRQNPLRVSSAENLEDTDILRLFVADPNSSLAAFSFNVNNIICGTYGSGKTMCLRAVEAFIYSQLVLDLVETGRSGVVPVRVNLSEIGQISDPEAIYKAIILRVFRSLLGVGRSLQKIVSEKSWFPTFKDWRDKLTRAGIYAFDERYAKLSASSVESQTKKSFQLGAQSPAASFVSLLSKLEAERSQKLHETPSPSIVDLNDLHQGFLGQYCDRILLLLDEVGSLHPDFFVTKGAAPSGYETLMNQLRTSKHLYYKVCVYPGHHSDALQESRYGTRINLDYAVSDQPSFLAYSNLCGAILERYIRAVQEENDTRKFGDFIDVRGGPSSAGSHYCGNGGGSALEQLCFASGGVFRRLFALGSRAMQAAVQSNGHNGPIVDCATVFGCLERAGTEALSRHSPLERSQLGEIAAACQKAGTFRFTSELDARSLLKPFLSKTQQDSILVLSEHAARPGGTVYEFDYAYCVANGLPTHQHQRTGAVCCARTLVHAKWIEKVANLTEVVLSLSGLTRGVIVRYLPTNGFGFIMYDANQEQAFFHVNDIVDFGNHSAQEDLRNLHVRFALGDTPKGKKARSLVIES